MNLRKNRKRGETKGYKERNFKMRKTRLKVRKMGEWKGIKILSRVRIRKMLITRKCDAYYNYYYYWDYLAEGRTQGAISPRKVSRVSRSTGPL